MGFRQVESVKKGFIVTQDNHNTKHVSKQLNKTIDSKIHLIYLAVGKRGLVFLTLSPPFAQNRTARHCTSIWISHYVPPGGYQWHSEFVVDY